MEDKLCTRRKAAFLLNTKDCVFLDSNRASCLFQSVDLKSILGDLFDKYEFFNISLQYVAMSSDSAGGSLTNHSRFNNVYVTGLAFENCNYNIFSGCNRAEACLGYWSMYGAQTGLGCTQVCTDNSACTFRKGSSIVDLKIDMTKILYDPAGANSNQLNNSSAALVYGSRIYSFSIVPCYDYSETVCTIGINQNQVLYSINNYTNKQFPINMKTLMGELYRKYNVFSMEITQMASTAVSANINNNSRVDFINYGGLPFDTSTYNQATQKNGSRINMSVVDFSGAGGNVDIAQYTHPDTTAVIIRNPPENIVLNLQYHNNQLNNTLMQIDSGNFVGVNCLLKFKPIS